jgi:hypothetical protein
MRRVIGLLLAGTLIAGCAIQAQESKKGAALLEEMRRREKEIQAKEKLQEWKKIAWRPTASDAVADATKEGKPLLIVLIVGERGQPKAERC